MNAMLEPRMVAAKIHGPFTAAGWEQGLLRIAASSQGGLAIVAIHPFSAGSLSHANPPLTILVPSSLLETRLLPTPFAIASTVTVSPRLDHTHQIVVPLVG